MKEEQKLYRVTLRGMTYSSTGVVEGISYVVATNAEEAYQKVKKRLDEKETMALVRIGNSIKLNFWQALTNIQGRELCFICNYLYALLYGLYALAVLMAYNSLYPNKINP